LLCTPLLVASEWVTACDIVGRATIEHSEDKFEGVGRWSQRACTIDAQPCGSETFCTGRENSPMLTVSLKLEKKFTKIRGAFSERSTGDNPADDCLSGHQPHTRYGERVSEHGGITVFGTDNKILYPGCKCNGNCKFLKIDLNEEEVTETDVLILESHQSVTTETFQFDLSDVEVWTGSTSTATTNTVTTTTNTEFQALMAKVKALEAMGNDAKLEDLELLLTAVVSEFETEKEAAAQRESALRTRVSDLETEAETNGQALRDEFNAFKLETAANWDLLAARFQGASDLAARAGEGSVNDDDESRNTQSCSGAECIPSIGADGADIIVKAPGGMVQFQSANCAESADLCLLSQKVQTIVDAIYGMGSD